MKLMSLQWNGFIDSPIENLLVSSERHQWTQIMINLSGTQMAQFNQEGERDWKSQELMSRQPTHFSKASDIEFVSFFCAFLFLFFLFFSKVL